MASAPTTRHHKVSKEFPQDSMFQQLVHRGNALYAHLTEDASHEAFAPHFTILRADTLPNRRIPFHFIKRVA